MFCKNVDSGNFFFINNGITRTAQHLVDVISINMNTLTSSSEVYKYAIGNITKQL